MGSQKPDLTRVRIPCALSTGAIGTILGGNGPATGTILGGIPCALLAEELCACLGVEATGLEGACLGTEPTEDVGIEVSSGAPHAR
jgi:hypothetical protein